MEGIVPGKGEFINIALQSHNSWERQACKHVPITHKSLKYKHQEQRAVERARKVNSFQLQGRAQEDEGEIFKRLLKGV